MALTTYTELKAAIADVANRTDLTAQIVDAVALAEAEMQVDCKLLEFETTGNIVITAGVGALPAGFLGMRASYWDTDPDVSLVYVTPEQFNLMNDGGDNHYAYTITGASIKLPTTEDGTVVATYLARFTALSGSNASNAILASFPNAYLYGSLKHLSIVTEDDAKLQKFGVLFNAEKERIRTNNEQRRFAGPLAVRAR